MRAPFRCPEAQLDRFLIRMSMGYPGRAGELEMLERQHRRIPSIDLQQSTRLEDLVRAQAAIKEVHVAAPVREYIVTLVEATRRHDDVYLGSLAPRLASPLQRHARLGRPAWTRLRDPGRRQDACRGDARAQDHRQSRGADQKCR